MNISMNLYHQMDSLKSHSSSKKKTLQNPNSSLVTFLQFAKGVLRKLSQLRNITSIWKKNERKFKKC